MQRIALVRATTGEMIHPDVQVKPGDDVLKVSQPGAINFSVDPEWETMMAHDGSLMFEKRKTLVVVEAANRHIANVGLVDNVDPQAGRLIISCGGVSMIAGQSGPWEGQQGWFVETDPVTLFRDIWEQVQSYSGADLGIRVTGDVSSGGMVGYPGSSRWQAAKRALDRARPEFDVWTDRQRKRERAEQRLMEAVFKAVNLKRVGSIKVSDQEPDSPAWEADSTIWVHESQQRAYRWRDGRWISQSQADRAVAEWLDMRRLSEYAKREVDRYQYQIEPLESRLEELELEAREPYTLYFWQNHDMADVIDDLMTLGPFEYRERATWVKRSDGNDRLDLQLEVGVPRVGVRREELHLEFGVNIQGDYTREYGPVYTGVAQFGAGSGSAVLSEQRDWNPQHVVRNILTETDKDAYNRALVRSAANRLRDRARGEAGIKFSSLTIYHDKACPAGSFEEGDSFRITGKLDGGVRINQWVRVMEAKRIWGKNQTQVEVVNV